MKIELNHIKISDLTKDYSNSDEEGIFGYFGKLDIRPQYQREFIYDENKQKAVIDTILKGFPLNVMYWVKLPNGRYEVMDGQQRTLSICEYVAGHFSAMINGYPKPFDNLPKDLKKKLIDYELMVYFCEGTDSEKLEWFKTVNIAGEELTDQEMLNAVYAGPWTSDAKRKFSKTKCLAWRIGNKYLTGDTLRQDYLATALKWINNNNPKDYMSKHQSDPNANILWAYFQSVITWVKDTFPKYRKEMKGLPWGELYNKYHENMYDTKKLEDRITELMIDDDVTSRKGIYEYVLSGNEKTLNIRAFSEAMKRSAYEKQKGICKICENHFEIGEMEADHITPWHEGGKTDAKNCQMLCRDCNRHKSGK